MLDDAAVGAFRAAILEGSDSRDRPFPWRLQRDSYAVLVGEVLLQRTRGENAAPVYREFLRRWPTPGHLARAREKTVARVIRPLGLVKRAQIMIRLGKAIVESGGVPTDPGLLEDLPGVGPYAAHAVPVFAN